MRHICLYIGVKIFSAGVRVYGCTGGRAGPPEVVQEALADLKRKNRRRTENGKDMGICFVGDQPSPPLLGPARGKR